MAAVSKWPASSRHLPAGARLRKTWPRSVVVGRGGRDLIHRACLYAGPARPVHPVIAVAGSIGHAIAAALPGLRPVASKPRLEVFGFDTGHHLRHECLLAVLRCPAPTQSVTASARTLQARPVRAGGPLARSRRMA